MTLRVGPATWERLRQLGTLEGPGDRLMIGLALITLTLITPYVPLPGTLPAIRFEQILMLILVMPFAALLRRHPEFRRVGLIDVGFAALAIATTVTIVVAPLVIAGVTRSFRDPFEVVRIGEYWLVYRVGLTIVPAAASGLRTARLLAVAALMLGLIAVLQYLNPPGFNDLVTAIWTQSHNLLGVTHEGRAVGTAGNANEFAILAVLLLFVALAGRLTVDTTNQWWLWAGAIVAATVSLGVAQSRGALLGAALGLLLAAGLLAARRGVLRALRLAGPPVAVAVVILLALIAAAPPSTGSILGRFDFAAFLHDPSVIIRLGRVESLFTAAAPTLPVAGGDRTACVTSLTPPIAPLRGHEPGASPLTAAAVAGADQVAAAVAGFYCDHGQWPNDLTRDLVPAYLSAVSRAPDGSALGLYTSARGFAVGEPTSVSDPLEDAGAGSFPNLLANPSFDNGGDPPGQWLLGSGTEAATSYGSAPFGQAVADVRMPAAGSVYQLVVASLPVSLELTLGIWARTVDLPSAPLQLYVVASTTDGRRIDPIAASTVEVGSTGWRHLAMTFTTPPADLTFLQVMVRAPDSPIHVLLDGASLTEGPYALPFGALNDQAASSIASTGPSFLDSPIVGVGPQKDETVPAYDNEYAMFLTQYGLAGLVAYCFLFLTAFVAGVRAALRAPPWGGLLGVALAAFTVALGAFAVSAGAYHQLQVMVIYWLVVGVTVALIPSRNVGAPAAEPRS